MSPTPTEGENKKNTKQQHHNDWEWKFVERDK
jgi:hypothetical protein